MEIGPAADFKNGSGSRPGADNAPPDSSDFQPRRVISKHFIWFAAALAAVTAAVFAPVRHFGFLVFDDLEYITDNARVLGGVTWDGVVWAFSTGYFSNWHPLTWISHMLDAQIYGTNAGGHHATSVLLHIANTLLLFGLLIRMTGKTGRSAFVAALFAVHPLHVESVAWVSERKDVLSTLFGLLTIWGYVRYVERPRAGRYGVVVLLFVMGLMAKPMLVTLPFVLLLLDVWPLGRIKLPASASGDVAGTSLREQGPVVARLVWEKAPLFVLAAASSIVTYVVQQRWGAVEGLATMPLDFRVANAVVSYVTYIAKMLWPAGLAALYPFPETLPGWQVFGSLFVLIGVTLAVLRAGPSRAYLPVGWFWYLGTLVPVIGLVQVGQQAMADRYSYVPLIGLLIMAGWGVPDLLANWRHRSIALPAVSVAAILACAVVAQGQVRYWQSDKLLWTHALEVTSGNYVARNNLGTALAKEGKPQEALAHYAEALRLRPDYVDVYYNVGTVFMSQRRFDDALVYYAEVLRRNPDHAQAHNNVGVLLKNQGRIEEAIAHYAEALRLDPGHTNAHYNLGNALASQGKNAEAIAHYTRALELSPTNETIRRALEELRSRP